MTKTGTPEYNAPEIFKSHAYSEKVDIWSVGVILYQVLSKGIMPFYSENIPKLINQITVN